MSSSVLRTLKVIHTYFYRIIITAFVIVMGSTSFVWAAETALNKDDTIRMIPNELYLYAKSQGCSQVSEYYMTPDIYGAPYVFGILPVEDGDSYDDNYRKQESAAFWCETPQKDSQIEDNNYTLLLKLNGFNWPGGCAPRIDNMSIGGLSVSQESQPIEIMYKHKNKDDGKPSVESRPGGQTKGPVLQTHIDGHIYSLYCHNGQWVHLWPFGEF